MPEPSNAASWFIARAGASQGPYTWTQLRSAAKKGLVRPRDWVWQKGMRRWVRAEEQEGLLATTVPPPVPTTGPPPVPLDDDPEEASIDSDDVIASAREETVSARPPPSPRAASGSIDLTRRAPAMRQPSRTPGGGGDNVWLPTPRPPASPTHALGETTKVFLAAAGITERARRRRQRRATLAALIAIGVVIAISQYVASTRPPGSKLDLKSALLLGAGPTPVSEEEDAASVGLAQAGSAGLSEAQTSVVQETVAASLKRCKGVFAGSPVVVRVATDPRGRVREAVVPRGPSSVRRCLEKRARSWRFGSILASRALVLKVPAEEGVVRVSLDARE